MWYCLLNPLKTLSVICQEQWSYHLKQGHNIRAYIFIKLDFFLWDLAFFNPFDYDTWCQWVPKKIRREVFKER